MGGRKPFPLHVTEVPGFKFAALIKETLKTHQGAENKMNNQLQQPDPEFD